MSKFFVLHFNARVIEAKRFPFSISFLNASRGAFREIDSSRFTSNWLLPRFRRGGKIRAFSLCKWFWYHVGAAAAVIQYRLTLHVVNGVSKELYCKVGAAHRVERFNFNRLGAQNVYNFVAFAGPSCSPSLHSFGKEFSSESNSLFERMWRWAEANGAWKGLRARHSWL